MSMVGFWIFDFGFWIVKPVGRKEAQKARKLQQAMDAGDLEFYFFCHELHEFSRIKTCLPSLKTNS